MAKKRQAVIDPDTGEVLDPRTSPDYYWIETIRNAEVWTPKAVRAEYSRLRKIANQRLARMAQDPIGRRSLTYRANIGQYKPLSEMTLGETKLALAKVARMISAETGTITGIKRQIRKSVKTLHEHGFTAIGYENFQDFGEFMRQWKDTQFRVIGSDLAAEMFNVTAKKEIDVDLLMSQFETFMSEQMEQQAKNAKPVNDTKIMKDWQKSMKNWRDSK